jgi:protein tyrosine phosphatase (PTP) superfamily phosphohydrolase (DUF442 family)
LEGKMGDPIAWLEPGPDMPGRIAFLAFPGLSILSRGNLFVDPDAQEAIVARLAASGCAVFIALADEWETPEGEFEAAAGALREAGIAFQHLPVEDFGIPDAAFLERWNALRPELLSVLTQGGSVAMSCLAGFGRSGMMAAQLLIDCGFSSAAAIEAVRAARPSAIESEVQVRFLLAQERAVP